MNLRHAAIAFAAAVALPQAGAAAGLPFVDHSRSVRLLDFELHGLVGGSVVTQNYRSCFPEISELDVTMGMSGGVGAAAQINITRFVALGVEFDFLVNEHSMNMAVADDNATSISNVFVRNRNMALNFPVYCRLNFNLAQTVIWNIDAGAFYDYGLTGRSRTSLYSAMVNSLGQLVTTMTSDRTDYYNNSGSFVNSYYRGDYGLHIATGLTFNRRIAVGVRSQIGFKNVANTFDAVVRPRVHNFSMHFVLGWKF